VGKNRELWERLEALDKDRVDHGSLSGDDARQYDSLKSALKESTKRALGGRIKYVYGGAPMRRELRTFSTDRYSAARYLRLNRVRRGNIERHWR
jgi:hypothetical protein